MCPHYRCAGPCICRPISLLLHISSNNAMLLSTFSSPLEFFFQEQSYSSLHSGRSSAWDHVRGDIDDPCGAIADFCGVIADLCGVITDPFGDRRRRCGDADRSRLAKYHKTLLNILKHHERHVKHCETL